MLNKIKTCFTTDELTQMHFKCCSIFFHRQEKENDRFTQSLSAQTLYLIPGCRTGRFFALKNEIFSGGNYYSF